MTYPSPIKTSMLLTLLVIAFNSHAQDPCNCDKALPDGLRDEITTIYNVNLDSSMSIIYDKSFTYWENGEWKNDQSMQSGGQAYYDMFSGFLNGNKNEDSKYEQFKRDSITYHANKSLSFSQYKYLSQKTASLTAYTAWTTCQLNCPNVEGCILQQMPQIAGQLTINLRCKTQHSHRPIKITHIEHPNVVIVSGDIQEGKKIKWGQEYSGTFKLIDPAQNGIVKINLEDNWQTEEVIIASPVHLLSKPLPDSTVLIGNGRININSRMMSNWSALPADPVNLWLNVPVDSSWAYEAAWVKANGKINAHSEQNYYTWILNVVNQYGVKTPATGASSAGVYPQYATNINLPALPNYSNLHYTLLLKCQINTDNHLQNPERSSERGRVTLTSDQLDTTLFVPFDSVGPALMKLENLHPGFYQLQMSGYHEQVSAWNGSQKLGFSNTVKLEAYVTTLGNLIAPPPKPAPVSNKSSAIWFIVGLVLVGLLVWLIVVLKKRRK